MKPNESYTNFLARLETAISYTVIGEETKKQVEKLLAYENASQECQSAIAAIHKTGTIIDYLKVYHHLRSQKKTLKKYKQVGNVIKNMATQVSLSPMGQTLSGFKLWRFEILGRKYQISAVIQKL